MGPNLDSKSVEKIESLAKTMDRELSSVEAKIVASMLQVVHLDSIFNWFNIFGLTLQCIKFRVDKICFSLLFDLISFLMDYEKNFD